MSFIRGCCVVAKLKSFFAQNKGKWLWAVAAFSLCALLPEYVFPFVLVIAYIKTVSFKKITLSTISIPGVFLLLYAAWQITGLFYSGSAVSGLSGIAVWLGGFICVMMMSRSVDSPLKLDTVMFAGSIGGGIAGGIGVMQMVLFHYGELIWAPLKTLLNPFWHQLDNLVAKLAINYLLPDFARKYIQREEFISIEERASSTFTNPVMFAAFLTMMLPLAVYCMFYLDGKVKKAVGFGCAVLIVGGIAASYSRGPYLALAAAFIVLLFYGGKRTLALLGIGVGGIAAVALVADGVFKRLLTLFSGNDISVNTRSKIWSACFEMLDGHWIFGYGTGVNNIREQLHNTYNINQPHAHNIFIQSTLENGLIGSSLLLASFIVFGIMMLRLCRKGKKERAVAITLIASLLSFCACGMTDCLFYGLKLNIYMMMFFGIASAAVNIYLKKKE